MGSFDLDLQAVESEIREDEDGTMPERRVILGMLDGTTDDEEWIDLVADGSILVLKVEGDVNERAAGFARDVREMDGDLMHFRGFLIVTPDGVDIDTTRLA